MRGPDGFICRCNGWAKLASMWKIFFEILGLPRSSPVSSRASSLKPIDFTSAPARASPSFLAHVVQPFSRPRRSMPRLGARSKSIAMNSITRRARVTGRRKLALLAQAAASAARLAMAPPAAAPSRHCVSRRRRHAFANGGDSRFARHRWRPAFVPARARYFRTVGAIRTIRRLKWIKTIMASSRSYSRLASPC